MMNTRTFVVAVIALGVLLRFHSSAGAAARPAPFRTPEEAAWTKPRACLAGHRCKLVSRQICLARGWSKPRVRRFARSHCTAYLLRMSFRVAYDGRTNPIVLPRSLTCGREWAHVPVSIRCTVVRYPKRFRVVMVDGHIVDSRGDDDVTILVGPRGEVNVGRV
jgi:hypothetical protein